LDLSIVIALAVAVVGVLTEVLFFRGRDLWSARVYARLGRSPLNFYWREYWISRTSFKRREQLLMSFTTFFVIGMLCAFAYFIVRSAFH
jgi:hypothetical protein